MTSTYDLRTAFFQDMQSLSYSDLETVKPHSVFNPEDISGTVSVRQGMLIEPEVVMTGFSDGAYNRLEGIYQIDIWVPRKINGALGRLDTLKDGHIAHFWPANGRGKTVSYNGQDAHITTRPEATSLTRRASYLSTQISVYFYIEERPA